MRSLWPKSLFARNWALLVVFAVVVQFATIITYMLSQRPAAVELGSLVASQVNLMELALSKVPATARDSVVQEVQRDGRLVPASGVEQPPERHGHGVLLDAFLKTVTGQVTPGVKIAWSDAPESELWAKLNISGEPYWLILPMHSLVRSAGLNTTIVLILVLALMATVVASLIQRRINRPLIAIGEAARRIGEGGRPERLPSFPTNELAAVAKQFNSMCENLEAMESSRAVMLAGISHDIRTPLTKLRLALALDRRPDESSVNQFIDQIDVIVGQFLDYGRSGSDEPLIEQNLNTLILQIAAEFEERGQIFLLDLGQLPPLRFRPIAMLRVIRNLMDNAVKYGVTGLEVRTWFDRDEIGVDVLDRGPGIGKNTGEQLLRPFTRADAGRSSVSGTGLGLAIADHLARLHGGGVDLQPRPSGGLQARICLPCRSPPRAELDLRSVQLMRSHS